MIPGAFEYHRPQKVDDAIALLVKHGEDARVVAGGHSLIPMMKLRLAVPAHLVDLQDIAELRAIRSDGGTLVVGALATQREVIGSEPLASKCPILRETALQIADPQVRYVGTIGGNVANGDPANDMPAVMMALGASYRIRGGRGERDIPARDFYRGSLVTALEAGDILTSIRIPTPPQGHGYAYEKQKRKTGDYATAAAAVILTFSRDACSSAAVALTNVAPTPLFATAAGEALVGTRLDEAAVAEAVRRARAIVEPAADQRGPVDFRVHVAGVMVRRAIQRAKARAS
ncbi:MAG TPA: xanthine dehydrogenase family protein subunit M [Alphaproteobacteria bacterium]|nr:xanthine dehydrogenase family protein subunit M [Alphaproteobacteria bacterium]